MPKSGTHLLKAIVATLPKVMLSGIRIRMADVRQGGAPGRTEAEFRLDGEALRARLRSAHPGQLVTAHLPWRPEIEPVLHDLGVRTLYLVRDPRDIVVSQMHYRVHLRRHARHKRMMAEFNTDSDRLMACINGLPPRDGETGVPPIGARLDQRAGWATMAGVHATRFENLVGTRGGGDAEVQRQEVKAIAAHVGRPLSDLEVDQLIARVAGQSSFTFRRGVIGDWRNHFTEEHKKVFKERAGQHLIELGYETNFDW